jgi:uncharacterized protein (TIGR02118 family)
MIFRSAIFSRRPGLSEAGFGHHWRTVHGELARHMPGVHRYRQNHIVERLYELQPFPSHEVGGISQQWFDDVAAMERCERSDAYAAVKRDIPNFQGAITILVLQATELLAPPATDAAHSAHAAKLLVLARRQATTPDDRTLLPQLRDAALCADGPAPLRYVQNLVIDRAHPVAAGVPQGRVPVDAMAEMWFADRAALRAWALSRSGQAFLHGPALLNTLGVYAVEDITIV